MNDFLPLDQQLDDILADFQYSTGEFTDNSLTSLERRELAVDLVKDAIRMAGYGPAPMAGA
jgi:hypothetical protein